MRDRLTRILRLPAAVLGDGVCAAVLCAASLAGYAIVFRLAVAVLGT